jgi:uncharacterized membrane protein
MSMPVANTSIAGSFLKRARLLADPRFAALVVVLAVNDGFLKKSFPGLVTGKLSDFAGVAIVAIVLAVITGRPRWSCAATAVGFAALKLISIVAVLAAPFLGGVTRTDPTDLVALVVLVPTALWLEHHVARDEWSARTWVFLPLVLAVTVSTTTATSCIEALSITGVTTQSNGVLTASTRLAEVATSADGAFGSTARSSGNHLDADGGTARARRSH